MAKKGNKVRQTDAIRGSRSVLEGMAKHWLIYGHTDSPSARTATQKAWDMGVMATVEYLRRLKGTDGSEFRPAMDLLTSNKFAAQL
jgi:hypothetical protein